MGDDGQNIGESKSELFGTLSQLLDLTDMTILSSLKWGFNQANIASVSPFFTKGLKSVSNISLGINALSTVTTAVQGSKNGWRISDRINIGANVLGYVPDYGPAFSIGWFITDLVSEHNDGMSFSEYLQQFIEDWQFKKEFEKRRVTFEF